MLIVAGLVYSFVMDIGGGLSSRWIYGFRSPGCILIAEVILNRHVAILQRCCCRRFRRFRAGHTRHVPQPGPRARCPRHLILRPVAAVPPPPGLLLRRSSIPRPRHPLLQAVPPPPSRVPPPVPSRRPRGLPGLAQLLRFRSVLGEET